MSGFDRLIAEARKNLGRLGGLERLAEILERLEGRPLIPLPGGEKIEEIPIAMVQDGLEICEAVEIVRQLLAERGAPEPLIPVNDWLLVESATDRKLWRSSFVPEGWRLIAEPPLDLSLCLSPRLDHALERWARKPDPCQLAFESLEA